jgi:hypothetical protein
MSVMQSEQSAQHWMTVFRFRSLEFVGIYVMKQRFLLPSRWCSAYVMKQQFPVSRRLARVLADRGIRVPRLCSYAGKGPETAKAVASSSFSEIQQRGDCSLKDQGSRVVSRQWTEMAIMKSSLESHSFSVVAISNRRISQHWQPHGSSIDTTDRSDKPLIRLPCSLSFIF